MKENGKMINKMDMESNIKMEVKQKVFGLMANWFQIIRKQIIKILYI